MRNITAIYRKRIRDDCLERLGDEKSCNSRLRFLKIEVGQVWGAALIDDDGTRKPGYSMEIVHRHRYWCRGLNIARFTYLAVKLYVEKRPGDSITQTYWFDECGISDDENGYCTFHLTKVKE